MSNNRLFEILFFLLNCRKTSAAALAEQFGVSVRTIYRDIDTLSSAGVPIYTTTGRKGGVFLMDNYIIDRLFVTVQERHNMLSALKSLEATRFIDTAGLLNKLGSLFQDVQPDSIMVDFSPWGSEVSAEQQKFNTIKRSAETRKCLDVTYINSRGEERRRTVEPLKLYFKENTWYLFVFCRLQEDFRLLRLSRIIEYTETEMSFQREYDLQAYLAQSLSTYGELIHLEMTVSPGIKSQLCDIFSQEWITTLKNGDLHVSADLPDDEWLIAFLMSFGPALKHVSPRSLQDRLIERHHQALEYLERSDENNEK